VRRVLIAHDDHAAAITALTAVRQSSPPARSSAPATEIGLSVLRRATSSRTTPRNPVVSVRRQHIRFPQGSYLFQILRCCRRPGLVKAGHVWRLDGTRCRPMPPCTKPEHAAHAQGGEAAGKEINCLGCARPRSLMQERFGRYGKGKWAVSLLDELRRRQDRLARSPGRKGDGAEKRRSSSTSAARGSKKRAKAQPLPPGGNRMHRQPRRPILTRKPRQQQPRPGGVQKQSRLARSAMLRTADLEPLERLRRCHGRGLGEKGRWHTGRNKTSGTSPTPGQPISMKSDSPLSRATTARSAEWDSD